VFGPERLVFEGAPILKRPIRQDREERQPQISEGITIDTMVALPPLTGDEVERLATLKAQARERLRPQAIDARRAWAAGFAAAHGLSAQEADRIARTASEQHTLVPEFELEFDELGTRTVKEVLADAARFVGETLADPLEGEPYGRGKAKVLRRPDGLLMIHSFAHGGIRYQLEGQGVRLEDFYAYMPKHHYIYTPGGDAWPASSVNSRIPPVLLVDADGRPVLDANDKQKLIPANQWLDQHRPVEQMTWLPGAPKIIRDKLIDQGGWIQKPGVSILNLYRPPTLKLGDPNKADRWLDHVRKVYPDDADIFSTSWPIAFSDLRRRSITASYWAVLKASARIHCWSRSRWRSVRGISKTLDQSKCSDASIISSNPSPCASARRATSASSTATNSMSERRRCWRPRPMCCVLMRRICPNIRSSTSAPSSSPPITSTACT
jgi:hypothetical protein